LASQKTPDQSNITPNQTKQPKDGRKQSRSVIWNLPEKEQHLAQQKRTPATRLGVQQSQWKKDRKNAWDLLKAKGRALSETVGMGTD
jgi:hypothetical protein